MRALLLQQLSIPSLATRHYLPALSDEIASWEPSMNVVKLADMHGRMIGEWPDEQSEPIPDSTAGWLLWHIEWWWSEGVRGVNGHGSSDPSTHAWSGSVAASCSTLQELHDHWAELLSTTDLDHTRAGPLPSLQPLAVIGAWVNVELMKNVAELGQLIRLHANRR
jgi:hypothetical protein